MTENKRFIQKQDFFLDIDDLSISYACANEIDCKNIVDKLNELHDENIELHIQNDFLKDENQHMRDLVNENEQLKQQLASIDRLIDDLGSEEMCRQYNEIIGDVE